MRKTFIGYKTQNKLGEGLRLKGAEKAFIIAIFLRQGDERLIIQIGFFVVVVVEWFSQTEKSMKAVLNRSRFL